MNEKAKNRRSEFSLNKISNIERGRGDLFFRWIEYELTKRQVYFNSFRESIFLFPFKKIYRVFKTHLNIPTSCTLFLTDKCTNHLDIKKYKFSFHPHLKSD